MNVIVNKWGNSLAVRIPKSIAEGFGIHDGSAMEVRVTRGANPKIILEPTTPTLEDLLALVTPENSYSPIETGKPRGNEVW